MCEKVYILLLLVGIAIAGTVNVGKMGSTDDNFEFIIILPKST